MLFDYVQNTNHKIDYIPSDLLHVIKSQHIYQVQDEHMFAHTRTRSADIKNPAYHKIII